MRIRFSDTEWLVPLSGISAGLLLTDRDVSLHLSHDPTKLSHYNTISNAGIGALVGGAAGMWLLSYPSHNDHWRETGLLAGQAALNSLVAKRRLNTRWAASGHCRRMARGIFFKQELRSPPSTPQRPGQSQA